MTSVDHLVSLSATLARIMDIAGGQRGQALAHGFSQEAAEQMGVMAYEAVVANAFGMIP